MAAEAAESEDSRVGEQPFRDRGLMGHTSGSLSHTNSVVEDVMAEIRLLFYRLDVISEWPASDRKDCLISSTQQRLRRLGADL